LLSQTNNTVRNSGDSLTGSAGATPFAIHSGVLAPYLLVV